MTFLRTLFTTALLAPAALAQNAKLSLLEFIPESAPLIIHIDDVAKFSEQWKASPLGQITEDEKMRAFLAPAFEKMKDVFGEIPGKDTIPEALTEAKDQFTGELVFAISKAPIESWIKSDISDVDFEDGDAQIEEDTDFDPDQFPDMILLGTVADGAAFMKTTDDLFDIIKNAEDADKSAEKRTTETLETGKIEDIEYRFLRVYKKGEDKPIELLAYGHVGKTAVIGWPKSHVESTLLTLKKQDLGAPSAAGGALADFRDRFPESTSAIQLNLESSIDELFTALKNGTKSGDIDLSALDQFNITLPSLRDALALDDLRALTFGLEMHDDKVAMDMGILYHKRSGLMDLLAYRKGKVDLPEYVPANIPSASISRFNFSDMWKEFRKTLVKLSPALNEQFTASMENTQKEMGINFENDLINHLGEVLMQFEGLGDLTDLEDEEGQVTGDTVTVMELKDAMSFEIGLDNLIGTMGPQLGLTFETREYLGTKMQAIDIPNGEIAYFLKENFLFLSNGQGKIIRQILSAMDRPGDSLWQQPIVKKNLAQLQPGYSQLSYVKISAVLDTLIGALAPLADVMDEDIPLDFDAKPEAAHLERIFGDMVGVSYIEKNGFFSQTFLLPKK
jgi:hypothetical protein